MAQGPALPSAKKLAAEMDAGLRGLADQSVESIRAFRGRYSRRLRQAPAQYVIKLAKEFVKVSHGRWVAFELIRHHGAAIAEFRQTREPIDELFGWLAASYALNGQTDEAKAAMDEYLGRAERNMAVFPGRRLEGWRDYWKWIAAYKNPADLEHLMDGLMKAGLED